MTDAVAGISEVFEGQGGRPTSHQFRQIFGDAGWMKENETPQVDTNLFFWVTTTMSRCCMKWGCMIVQGAEKSPLTSSVRVWFPVSSMCIYVCLYVESDFLVYGTLKLILFCKCGQINLNVSWTNRGGHFHTDCTSGVCVASWLIWSQAQSDQMLPLNVRTKSKHCTRLPSCGQDKYLTLLWAHLKF